jgi:hypothetical protein
MREKTFSVFIAFPAMGLVSIKAEPIVVPSENSSFGFKNTIGIQIDVMVSHAARLV